jgi:predicted acyltransferase
VGALALLVAAIWASAAGEWLRGEPRPAAWRGLCAVGVACFVAGWVWQIVGYYRVGALTFW